MSEGNAEEELTPETVVSLLEDTNERVMETVEIADALAVKRWKAREVLRELAREDAVAYKVINPQTTVWWAPE